MTNLPSQIAKSLKTYNFLIASHSFQERSETNDQVHSVFWQEVFKITHSRHTVKQTAASARRPGSRAVERIQVALDCQKLYSRQWCGQSRQLSAERDDKVF
ncbi:hypothetical protein T10_13488 [Trichinella papuae]|uniref:Uncharacterized protein n=1 Tax=Trichinella papuae TaxID=268474 RepID=A0A0V1N0H3_9BILA|nr:hypothetical protein T10_13488 [Trichinella papuae]